MYLYEGRTCESGCCGQVNVASRNGANQRLTLPDSFVTAVRASLGDADEGAQYVLH